MFMGCGRRIVTMLAYLEMRRKHLLQYTAITERRDGKAMESQNAAAEGKLRAVVIYAKEDIPLVEPLVLHLQSRELDVWWAEGNLSQGLWDVEVRKRIEASEALIPFVTPHTGSHQIFRDEWAHAQKHGKAIFPFVVSDDGIPLGMGGYSHTPAPAWGGDVKDACVSQLRSKIYSYFQLRNAVANDLTVERNSRIHEVSVGQKKLLLPTFVFSLSGFETQLHPLDGLQLLGQLPVSACLVSAYDLHGKGKNYSGSLDGILRSDRVLFLDSGNYEATRKDAHAKRSKDPGWCVQHFWEVANSQPWDIVFSYDHPALTGEPAGVADKLLDAYFRDMLHTGLGRTTLCPIVHAISQNKSPKQRRVDTANLVRWVAEEIRPTLVAIPERELGDGLAERMRSVRAIRAALASLAWYQPLHILGTGNPVSMAALALCGADSFDGLEWCRTAANYETNNLMHFQQFDLLEEAFASRMTFEDARRIVEWNEAPFALRAASYNFDYFMNWAATIRYSVQSLKPETLFQAIPYLGNALTKEFLNGANSDR